MRRETETAERLRAAGLRVTPQRRAVLAVLEEDGHLAAEEVLALARRDLPGLARATVYNALGDLVRAGLLRSVEGFGAARYDSNLDPDHQHFRCRGCARLYDVRVEGVETLRLRDGRGFVVDRPTVFYEGLCPGCVPAA